MPEIVRQAATAARWAALLITVVCVAACAGVSNSAVSTAATTPTTTPQSSTPVAPPPTTGSATLTWVAPTENTDGTPLTDLAGYTIRYGTQADAMTHSIAGLSTETTSYEISNLAPGTYYFEVIAYTTVGTESAPSDVASKTI